MGPLSGLRVIDCATYIAAPAAATIMSDYGADVIKVERPPHGDPYRYLSLVPGTPSSDLQYMWLLDGRNKRSIALDLSLESERDVLRRLIATADVFITNYQPQLTRKFGVTYEELAALNDRLIYAHLTGYGEQGPEVDKPGYDMTAYWARSGLMNFIHLEGAEPAFSPSGFGDHPTAVALFSSIMLALYNREKTGRGMKVGTSLIANGAWSHSCLIQAALVGAEFPQRRSRNDAVNPLVNHYKTRDGKRMLFCLLDPVKDWHNLCRAIERPDLIDHPDCCTPASRRNNKDFIAMLDTAFAQKDYVEWVRIFAEHDVIWGPVPDAQDVARDPQMEAAGVFAEFDHPTHGRLRTVTNPIRLDGFPQAPPRCAPKVGEHTAEILAELRDLDIE